MDHLRPFMEHFISNVSLVSLYMNHSSYAYGVSVSGKTSFCEALAPQDVPRTNTKIPLHLIVQVSRVGDAGL